jgi:hypothetical protein
MFCGVPETKKACYHTICRLLLGFETILEGMPQQHLEGILAVIKEIYKKVICLVI